MSMRKIYALGVAGVLLIVSLILFGKVFEHINADDILVVQSPIKGDLAWYTDAGIKPQWFGKTSIYKKRSIYRFDTERYEEIKDKDGNVIEKKLVCCGLEVRFNDGGHGTMLGSIQYDMPLDEKNLTAIHTRYGSQEAVQQQIIETSANKAIYHAGPTMSSKESYAEKRNDLIHYVEDQIQHGVYKTRQREIRVKDQLSGQDKTITVAEIVVGENGKPERQEISALAEFGIRAFNFTIKRLPYDQTVETQIQQQQQIAMDVQTSVASAKKGEQRAITAEWEGKANATQAKWEQEKENAKEIAMAEKNKIVATLSAQAAEQTRRKDILLGEGEATRKRLVMEADGALQSKIDAVVTINKGYAEAIKDYSGNWVPTIVMGNATGTQRAGSGAQEMIDLLTANAARQLGVDLGVIGMSKTAGKATVGKKSAPAPAIAEQVSE